MNNTLRARDDHTTYRIAIGNPLWVITSYRPSDYITDCGYRFDALPDWMREGIQLLDVAGSGVVIEPIRAKRTGDQYWFFAVDENPLTGVPWPSFPTSKE